MMISIVGIDLMLSYGFIRDIVLSVKIVGMCGLLGTATPVSYEGSSPTSLMVADVVAFSRPTLRLARLRRLYSTMFDTFHAFHSDCSIMPV